MAIAIIKSKEISADSSYPDFILEVSATWSHSNQQYIHDYVLHQVNEGCNRVDFNATLDRLYKSSNPADRDIYVALDLARKEATEVSAQEAQFARSNGNTQTIQSPVIRIGIEHFTATVKVPDFIPA